MTSESTSHPPPPPHHQHHQKLEFTRPQKYPTNPRWTTSTLSLTVLAFISFRSVGSVSQEKISGTMIQIPRNLTSAEVNVYFNKEHKNRFLARGLSDMKNPKISIYDVKDLTNLSRTLRSGKKWNCLEDSEHQKIHGECMCPRRHGSKYKKGLNSCSDIVQLAHSSNIFSEERHLQRDDVTATYDPATSSFIHPLKQPPHHAPSKKCNAPQSDSIECTGKKRTPASTWIRRSGVEVRITMDNHTLGSGHYEDIDHVTRNENIFMLKNPGPTDDVVGFRNNSNNYCRFPVPDYYTLTLEISRDRTTEASEELCTRPLRVQNKCTKDTPTGFKFIFRSLNKPCTKLDSFPNYLDKAENSLACMSSSNLLTELFNMTPPTTRPPSWDLVHPITFPSQHCHRSRTSCEQCQLVNPCLSVDVEDLPCCQIDCLSGRECRLAHSSQCKDVSVECAMGNTFRYTLLPIFLRSPTHYRCHVKRKKVATFAQITATVFVSDINLQLGPFRLKLSNPPTTPLMTMKILNEMLPQPEELLVNAERTDAGDDAWSYFLQPLAGNFFPSSVPLHYSEATTNVIYNNNSNLIMNFPSFPDKTPGHSYSNNVHVIFTEFSRPFAYTTSSWLENGQCEKDMELFKMYSAAANHKTFLHPSKAALKRGSGSFVYFFQFLPEGPIMQIILPATTTLFDWWKMRMTDEHLDLESLVVQLSTLRHQSWIVSIYGQMSNCPSYLGIRFLSDHGTILNRDLLIACPLHFHVTINYTAMDSQLSKYLQIQLFDGRRRFHTSLFAIEQATPSGNDSHDRKLTPPLSKGVYYEGLLLYVGCLLAATFLILFSCLSNSLRRHKVVELFTPASSVSAPCVGKYAQNHEKFILKNKSDHSKETKLLFILFSYLFLFIRIFASLSLTFSFGYFTFYFHSEEDLNNARGNLSSLYQHIADYHRRIPVVNHAVSLEEGAFLVEKYAQLQSKAIGQSLENITSNFDYFRRRNVRFIIDRLSNVETQRSKKQNGFKQSVSIFVSKVHKSYRDATYLHFDDYAIYAKNVENNPWFYWAWHLFSRMREGSSRDFLFFLEAHETEEVLMQNSSFLNRLNAFAKHLNNSYWFRSKLLPCQILSNYEHSRKFNNYKYFVNHAHLFRLDEQHPIRKREPRNQPIIEPENIELSSFDLTIFYVIFPIFDVLLVSYGLVRVLVTLSKTLTFRSKFILCIATSSLLSNDSLSYTDLDVYSNVVSRQLNHYRCCICVKPLTDELLQTPLIANVFLSNKNKYTFLVVSVSHVLPNIIILALTFTILFFLPLWVNNFLKIELFPISLGSNYFEDLSEYHAEENSLTINIAQPEADVWREGSFRDLVEFQVLQEISSNLGKESNETTNQNNISYNCVLPNLQNRLDGDNLDELEQATSERTKGIVSCFESLSEKCLYFASLAIIIVASIQICDGAALKWEHEFSDERRSPQRVNKVPHENLIASNQVSSTSSTFENFFARSKDSPGFIPATCSSSSRRLDAKMAPKNKKQLLELNSSFIETIV